MLSEDFLYQLRQASPIDNIMSNYVHLIKRGRNYVCLCPFHNEKTPSCTVYPDNNSFFCFGCGAGGDIITFVRKIENLDYIEAVKYLAERAGIPLPDDAVNDNAAKVKARTLEINREAGRFYFKQLFSPQGEKGKRYFAQRQISPATIKKYGLGYAVNEWDKLYSYLKAKGYYDEEILTANLCAKSSRGTLYDIFRDRVIFPIIDLRGNVIAFGGRIIDGDGPKYLNSSDTPVFKKSRNLFSLNFAKGKTNNRLILAEGYMDVITINQAGFENVVATLGTALTSEQANLMSKYAKEVIISYDSDDPGQAATHKAINLLNEVGIKTKIIKMIGAKDPDEYIKKFGSTRFKLLLDNSKGAIDFELTKCASGLDLNADADKIEFLNRCVKVLSDVNSPIERDVYISKISDKFSVSKEILKQQVASTIKKNININKKKEWQSITTFSTYTKNRLDNDVLKYQKEYKAECGIIAYLFNNPDKVNKINEILPFDKFVTTFNKKVYEILSIKIKNSIDFSFSLLSNEFTVDEMGKISEMIAKSRDITISEYEINDYINILQKFTPDKDLLEISDEDFNNLSSKIGKGYINK